MEAMRDINRSGTTILMVEQNVKASLPIAHRVAVLKTGRKIYDGAPEPLADHVKLMESSEQQGPRRRRLRPGRVRGYPALHADSPAGRWWAYSRRVPPGLESAAIVSVDLLDRARCAEVFGAMRDVTHVVYAALFEKPGLIPGWRERDQMETNLAMLRNLLDPLAAARRTGARVAAPGHQGVRRPRRADAGAGPRAQPAPPARELLLAAGGLPPRAAGRARVGTGRSCGRR